MRRYERERERERAENERERENVSLRKSIGSIQYSVLLNEMGRPAESGKRDLWFCLVKRRVPICEPPFYLEKVEQSASDYWASKSIRFA